jgi:hypothetical protein
VTKKQPRQPASKTTRTETRKTGPKSTPSRTQLTQPESVQRFCSEVICVVAFTQLTEQALGPELMNEVLIEINNMGVLFVFQNERAVVNLTTRICTSKI